MNISKIISKLYISLGIIYILSASICTLVYDDNLKSPIIAIAMELFLPILLLLMLLSDHRKGLTENHLTIWDCSILPLATLPIPVLRYYDMYINVMLLILSTMSWVGLIGYIIYLKNYKLNKQK